MQQLAHLEAPASFDVAGLTWSGLVGKPVLQVRAHGSHGWGPWTDAGADGAGNGPGGSDALFTGAATRVEVRAYGPAGSRVLGLRVSLIDSTPTAHDASVAASATARKNLGMATGATSGYTYATMPTVVTRAQWGADESLLSHNGSGCLTPTYDQTIRAGVVHHTEGTNTYTADQSASIVRGIYAFHVLDRGWCDVGYNFLVDKYGQIFEGRHGAMDLPVHGAHATYWNTDTVGVSLMMNSDLAAPTPAMLASLYRVLAWKLAGNYVDPLAKVYLVNGTYNTILRHGDVMNTDCPGKQVSADMPTIRQGVAALMGNWRTPIYQAWQAQGGASGALGVPHRTEEAYNGGRMTVFTHGAVLQLPDATGSLTTTTRWMGSAIWSKYVALGGASQLGWPLSSQTPGTTPDRTVVDLPNGQSIVSTSSGTVAMTAAIKAAWWNNATMQAALGNPVSDAVTTSTGSHQVFQHGRIDIVNGAVRVTYGAVWGDQNNDGVADLATVPAGQQTVTFRLTAAGVASGSLAGPTLDASTTWAAQVPDVNHDGLGELVSRRSDGTMWLAYGRGQGSFTAPVQVGHGWGSLRELTVMPDMDGDHEPELLALDAASNLRRYWFTSTGRLTGGTLLASGWTQVTHIAAAGDFTGDGAQDLFAITSDGSLNLWAGTGSGGLASTPRSLGRGWGGFTRVWSIGDVTGDGRPDFLAQTASGTLLAYALTQNAVAHAVTYLPSTAGLGLLA